MSKLFFAFLQRAVLLYVFLLSHFIATSQSKFFNIELGIARRYQPLSLQDKSITVNIKNVFFQSSKQFKNYNFFIGISHPIKKDKIFLSLNTYVRYTHNHYQRNNFPNVYDEVKKVKFDETLTATFLSKQRNIKKFSFRYVYGFGAGVMNINSGFNFKETIAIDSSGNPYKVPVKGNFIFNAPDISAGLQSNRATVKFCLYVTPDDNYEKYFSIWPEINFSYALFK